MMGEYLRVTPLELDRTIRDPDWAQEFADDLADAKREAPDSADGKLADDRCFSTDKTWAALQFLLQRADCPVDVITGEESFTEDDWGYGPALYLPVERVRLAAAFLAGTPFDALIRGLTLADLAAAEIYPQVWDEPDAFDWIRGYYEELTAYFTSAAAVGDAMLLWIS